MCNLTKSQAEEKQTAFMQTVNGGEIEPDRDRPLLMGEFVNQVYLPFQRGKWKGSTKGTSESRIRAHIIKDLGTVQMQDFTPTGLQSYLDGKAATLGFSVVDHLRWDLTSIGDLAVAEKVLTANPARALYTPASAKKGASPVMTAVDVEKALGAVEFREKVILHPAVFCGLRPGEILALRRRSIGQDGSSVQIDQRVYRGDLDVPGTARAARSPFRRGQPRCFRSGSPLPSIPNQICGSSLQRIERHRSGGTTCCAATFRPSWRLSDWGGWTSK